ncbi:M28 family metallopeptidase [Nonomuraea sp. NBC_01738]|uniref:M28 family metallopeptidase n=1 Tax=Nonomuraea sp. NBC_01738 TaxID=2976003 RepID=UPI002E151E0B|nr:M28 family metallopeptidase [Nonomuraea sp. NBC_01738]
MTIVDSPASVPELATVLAEVSADRMTATVRELADDRFTGRRVGTAGGRAAADWLAARLRELNATVELTAFPVTGVRELYGTPTLEWAVGGETRRLEHRRDFAEHLASADLPTPLTAPVIADTEGADLRGRWALARDGAWAETCGRAEQGGAAGVLAARGTDADGWMPKMIAGPGVRAAPVLSLRTDLHRELWDAAARGGVQMTASIPLRPVDVEGHNVHARIGKGPVRVLLTAHYDGVGDDPERRLPAAADNASGVAAILEAARVLTTHAVPADLAVAFLDAEEAGAWGSAHHAPSVAPGTLVINLDGAAQLNQAASVEAGGPAQDLLSVLDQAARLSGLPLRAGPMASDNRRYAAAGLAAIGIGMGMPGYQTPAETPDRVEEETLVSAARLITATVWLLSQPRP